MYDIVIQFSHLQINSQVEWIFCHKVVASTFIIGTFPIIIEAFYTTKVQVTPIP